MSRAGVVCRFFFFNDTATTEIYTLSLHDALPISFPDWRALLSMVSIQWRSCRPVSHGGIGCCGGAAASLRCHGWQPEVLDRKSTRLNSSHANISYAVFCLKKKKNIHRTTRDRTLV